NEAVTLSVRPMIDKIAGAFSNGIVGAIAVAAGMTGTATASDITSSGRATFNTWAFYVPLALIVLSMLTYAFKVKIDEKMHARIVAELEAKLASGEIEDDLESDDENSDDGAAVIEPADIESVLAPAVADMRTVK
ncbi:MFS transporter, partial [Bifidobacterium magnum]